MTQNKIIIFIVAIALVYYVLDNLSQNTGRGGFEASTYANCRDAESGAYGEEGLKVYCHCITQTISSELNDDEVEAVQDGDTEILQAALRRSLDKVERCSIMANSAGKLPVLT